MAITITVVMAALIGAGLAAAHASDVAIGGGVVISAALGAALTYVVEARRTRRAGSARQGS